MMLTMLIRDEIRMSPVNKNAGKADLLKHKLAELLFLEHFRDCRRTLRH